MSQTEYHHTPRVLYAYCRGFGYVTPLQHYAHSSCFWYSGPLSQSKDRLSMYGDSHVKDKMVARPFYLWYGIPVRRHLYIETTPAVTWSRSFFSYPLHQRHILAWIDDYIHSKVWNEITCQFPNFNGCSLGMDKQFRPTLYTGYDYLSMLGLK